MLTDFVEKFKWNTAFLLTPKSVLPWETFLPDADLAKYVETGQIPAGKALDIGCGLGTQSIYLAKNGFEVDAVDISPNAISKAGKNAEINGVNIRLRVASACELPYQGKSFGFALDRGCFHAIPKESRGRYVQEVARVLKKGGKYLLFAFSDSSFVALNKFSKEELEELFLPYFEILEMQEAHHDKQFKVCLRVAFMQRR